MGQTQLPSNERSEGFADQMRRFDLQDVHQVVESAGIVREGPALHPRIRDFDQAQPPTQVRPSIGQQSRVAVDTGEIDGGNGFRRTG